jgi:hypothetical protein
MSTDSITSTHDLAFRDGLSAKNLASNPTGFADLKLTAWEKFMMADDRVGWPMTCHIRFWLSGPPLRRRLEKALSRVFDFHPLLYAKPAASQTGSDPTWIQSSKPVLEWYTCRVALDKMADERDRFATRWILQTTPDETILIVRFHHAVSDGIGIFSAFEDLVRFYNSSTTDEAHVDETDVMHAKIQKLHLRDARPLKNGLKQILWNMQRIMPFVMRLPNVERPWNVRMRDSNQMPRWTTVRSFGTADNMAAITQAAKASRCTVNDLMVTAMFEALSATAPSAKGWWRVGVPVSMREPAHETMSAANCVSMVFLDRRQLTLENKRALIRSVERELSLVKQRKTGDALWLVMRWLTRWPRLLEVLLGSPFSQCSAVLTNLGRPFHGSENIHGLDFRLESLDTIPPLRRGTCLALSVNSYARVPSYTLHYDDRAVGDESAREFLRRWVEALNSLVSTICGESHSQSVKPDIAH